MKPRHIIQVSSYYPPHLGGQEHAVRDLARQLAGVGHDVQVLTSRRGGGPRGWRREDEVDVCRLPGVVFGHAPIMPQFLPTLVGAARPDSLVHLHIGQAFTPEMTWLAAKLRGFRYVAQLHIDFEPSGPAGVLLPMYKNTLLRGALHGASAVAVLNEKTYQIVRERYGYKGHLLIINNGLDEAFFERRRADMPVAPPKELRLLFVGRLSKQKNLPALLRALTLTRHAVYLDIVGDGDQAEEVRQVIAALRLKNVTLHGRLSREEVTAFYETSHVLVMPSLYEAQPLVLLEAMAARIPIIGTDVIGVADHMRGAGIVATPTPEGLAEGIDRFVSEYATIPALVAEGYRRAEMMRWKNTLKKYEALYEEVLEA